MFRSWKSDILANINDRELDNKSAIQLIKEQTLDNAHREVKFQLDLCSGNITYRDLLQHLGVAFQGGDDEANILAEFYSRCQYAKESEESFADELQLLARKVISKKPDFQVNLDNTMKQWYASQLYDHSNVSIAKALLLQMPTILFTQYRNELARVLGTRQCPSKGVSTKAVSATQIRELLNPTMLQTAFTNALQASGQHFRTKGKFFGKRHDPIEAASIDGTMDPNKSCNYCKDMGHEKDNWLHLQKHNAFVVSKSRKG